MNIPTKINSYQISQNHLQVINGFSRRSRKKR